jgi:hypothetical protein
MKMLNEAVCNLEFNDCIMVLCNSEHNNFAEHSKTVTCEIECEHDLATPFTAHFLTRE